MTKKNETKTNQLLLEEKYLIKKKSKESISASIGSIQHIFELNMQFYHVWARSDRNYDFQKGYNIMKGSNSAPMGYTSSSSYLICSFTRPFSIHTDRCLQSSIQKYLTRTCLVYFYSKPIQVDNLFASSEKSSQTIYKHVSNKSKNCLSFGNSVVCLCPSSCLHRVMQRSGMLTKSQVYYSS